MKEKSRYFTFLLYPDSVPEDYFEKLETLDVPIAISPLHDKDESPNGGFKKPHWHVIYINKNPVTAESVRNKIRHLLGDKSVALVQIISCGIQSMYLYLTHESKDAIRKKKFVYKKSDIRLINNFDIDRYVVLDENEKKRLRKLLCQIIKDRHLVNVIELEEVLEHEGSKYDQSLLINLSELLSGQTFLFKLYFDANFHNGFRCRYCEHVDEVTGELVPSIYQLKEDEE